MNFFKYVASSARSPIFKLLSNYLIIISVFRRLNLFLNSYFHFYKLVDSENSYRTVFYYEAHKLSKTLSTGFETYSKYSVQVD